MDGKALVVFPGPWLDLSLTLQVHFFQKPPKKSLKSYDRIWRPSK